MKAAICFVFGAVYMAGGCFADGEIGLLRHIVGVLWVVAGAVFSGKEG
jgi:hypothetical protein